MVYVACEVLGGTPYVAAVEEVAEVAWCDRAKLGELVAHPLFGPVQAYLDANLA
jgi:8-oxo-dGTP diphosphatase